MTTYTQEEMAEAVRAAVETATAEYRTRVTELEAAAQSTEVAEAVAAIRAELEPRLTSTAAELAATAAKLDEAVLAAEAEKQRADQIVAWLEAEAGAAAQRIAQDARRDQRLAAVKEVACFPDEYLEANADRFAAMTDEDFDTALGSFKAITAAKGGTPPGGGIPSFTGLHASSEDNGSRQASAVKGFMAQRRLGRVDYSSL